jgi:hypothetical protein
MMQNHGVIIIHNVSLDPEISYRKYYRYIASCFLITTIVLFPTMTYPTVTSQDSYLQALKDMDNGVEGAREAVIAAQCDPSVPLGGLVGFTPATWLLLPLSLWTLGHILQCC